MIRKRNINPNRDRISRRMLHLPLPRPPALLLFRTLPFLAKTRSALNARMAMEAIAAVEIFMVVFLSSAVIEKWAAHYPHRKRVQHECNSELMPTQIEVANYCPACNFERFKMFHLFPNGLTLAHCMLDGYRLDLFSHVFQASYELSRLTTSFYGQYVGPSPTCSIGHQR